MLRYSIRLGANNVVASKPIQFGERYLDPSLSYFSGVTSPLYHVSSDNIAKVKTPYDSSTSNFKSESYIVTRQGYVLVKGKKYPLRAYHDTRYGESKTVTEYKYIEANGRFFSTSSSSLVLDKWLVPSGNTAVESSVTVNNITSSTTEISVDTLYWIEDSKVTIDGNTYVFDKNEETSNGKYGALKNYEEGDTIPPTEICKCTSMEFNVFDLKDFDTVEKFVVYNNNDSDALIDKVTYGKRFRYIAFKGISCAVERVSTDGGYKFIWRVPKSLLSENGEVSEYEDMPLYVSTQYDNSSSGLTDIELTSDNYSQHGIKYENDLDVPNIFGKIDDERLFMQSEIINANDGVNLLLYLTSRPFGFVEGDVIYVKDTSSNEFNLRVENMKNYGGEDKEFVFFKGRKYFVSNNTYDVVIVDGKECKVTYPSGIVNGVDAFVEIENELIPMRLTVSSSANTLTRYGKILSSDGSGNLVDATYNIISNNGVEIDGTVYKAYLDNEGASKLVTMNMSPTYALRIVEIKGSSLLYCEPYIESGEVTEDYKNTVMTEICQNIMSNPLSIATTLPSLAFGNKTLTPIYKSDFLDFVEVLVDSASLRINIPMSSDIATNAFQEEIVTRDFFEVEKAKAINPIVDMEKDVYVPKYLADTTYNGSESTFVPLRKINFNLHFRTRNQTSWKVNELYNLSDVSGKDNWFITDYEPYKTMLSTSTSCNDKLMEMSDLVGFLYFNNDDVFYQKSNLANSFLRLSFYDSVDSSSQSLLAMSTIFYDEHIAYKKFLDNSRKNINKYLVYDEDSETCMELNKINVSAEMVRGKNNTKYNYCNYNGTNIVTDDDNRISSRFTVTNKYETDTSSEGFYLYMFKEYSENLHPKPIYMKVEFNHAGIGKTIPFLIPMKWAKDSKTSIYNPTERYKLTENGLKEGYSLDYVYAQSYIPLYAVYDFKNKEYAYCFDSRYISIDKTNNVASLNLFELKIKDDSESGSTTERPTLIINRDTKFKE